MKEYGLLGYPLGHSFSRAFFLEKFACEGIDATYLNFELPSADQLPQVLAGHPDLRGLNVTLPHKQAVIPLLDDLSDEARAIGAVNVIRVTRHDGNVHLKGFNSDIIGFVDSIRPLLKPHHTKALVLGTGGASKAICHGLEKLGIEWRYVSRTRPSQQQSLPQEPTESAPPHLLRRHPIAACRLHSHRQLHSPRHAPQNRCRPSPALRCPLTTPPPLRPRLQSRSHPLHAARSPFRRHRQGRSRDATPPGYRQLGVLERERLNNVNDGHVFASSDIKE